MQLNYFDLLFLPVAEKWFNYNWKLSNPALPSWFRSSPNIIG